MIKVAKKRTTLNKAAAVAALSRKNEPQWDNVTEDDLKIKVIRAFAWYNSAYTIQDAIPLLKQYLESVDDKDTLRIVTKVDTWKIPLTLCFVARMFHLGLPQIDELRNYFTKTVDNLKQKVSEPKRLDTVVNESSKVCDLIGDIEEYIDEHSKNNFKKISSFSDWIKSREIAKKQYNFIVEYYTPLLEELSASDAKQYYSKLTTKQLNNYKSLVADIINVAATQSKVAKEVIRKKKPVTKEKLVSKLKYKEKDLVYDVTSINPISIIGSKELWVFNTKKRVFVRYQAASDSGITVHRSKLQNVQDSTGIKVRKPAVFLDKVLTQTAKTITGFLVKQKSKPIKVSVLLNKDTLLLKVIK